MTTLPSRLNPGSDEFKAAHAAMSEKLKAVREAVGINEVHNFGKYLVTGAGARDWLNRIMAGRIPKPARKSKPPSGVMDPIFATTGNMRSCNRPAMFSKRV